MQLKNKNWIKAAVAVALLVSHTVTPVLAASVKHSTGSAQQSSGQPMVVTPDLPHLPWKMENGVKVFHLTAEVVERELLPGSDMGPAKRIKVWGYNGTVPGPTIEINEGDHVRIIFHNNLPEDTTIHWHGFEVPIAMDGMPFISQPPVKPGGTFVYDFTLHQNGTYFYHSHGAMQEMMGMIGLFIIHPKKVYAPPVTRDFGIIVQEFAVLPNNEIANSMAMEFNWLTINGKAAPATTPLICKLGDRVRIRIVNLGMDHHPIHLHGNQFFVTGTEGGRIPNSAWYPGNTVLVGVAQARDIEFDAKYVGDFMLHCHLPHHMMNNMVSSVGPLSHVGQGMHTGMGIQEGMGIVREGNATGENIGPGLGRGLGITADREQNTSHVIGHTTENVSPNTEQSLSSSPSLGSDANTKTAVGYPQDATMMMPMDAAVARPENNGLAPGWSAALQGMMSLVRVLPADKYDKLMADIKAGRIDPAQMKGMQMDNMPGMNMNQGDMKNMPGMNMNHGDMKNMPGMDMKHGDMKNMPGMDMKHGDMKDMPGMNMKQDDMKNMPGMDMNDKGNKGTSAKKTKMQKTTPAKTKPPVKRKTAPSMEEQMKMNPNMKM
ncbi:MAG TPA: multicopper oxidase domain-containing protein [Oculatellaceae cyanobacterium]